MDVDRARSQRRPTLADVAAAAGVSRSTASRALTGGPNVSPHARESVWAAAERLGFEANHLARSLRRGSTLGIGLVVPDVGIGFYARAVKGAQEALDAAGYHVLTMNTERSARREREALRTLRSHQVDGVLIATSGGYEDIGVPAVFFDNEPPVRAAGSVLLCNAEGMDVLVDHLVRVHGHERLGYVGPPDAALGSGADFAHRAGRERLDGFRAAMGRAGLPVLPEYVRTSDPACTAASAGALTVSLLRLDQPPTAILAGADTLAIGVLQALRDHDLRVPDDVALVSFDEPAYADLLDPPITSLDRHDRELGQRAAQRLLAVLGAGDGNGNGDGPGEVVRVPLELRVRRSCGCVAA